MGVGAEQCGARRVRSRRRVAHDRGDVGGAAPGRGRRRGSGFREGKKVGHDRDSVGGRVTGFSHTPAGARAIERGAHPRSRRTTRSRRATGSRVRRTPTPPWSRSSAPATSSPTRARSARHWPAPTSAAAASPPAGAEFERAVEIDPVNDYAHFGLGLCLMRQRRPARRPSPPQAGGRDAARPARLPGRARAASPRPNDAPRDRQPEPTGRLPATSTACCGAATNRSRRRRRRRRAARRRPAGRRSCRTTRARRSPTSSPSSTAWASRRPRRRGHQRDGRRRGCSARRCAGRTGARVRRAGRASRHSPTRPASAVERRPADGGRRRLPPRASTTTRSTGRHGRCARALASSPPISTPPTRTAGGLIPGAGSLVAAVATAAGGTPEVAGKPEAPTVASSASASAPPAWWWATARRPTARWPPLSAGRSRSCSPASPRRCAPPGGEAIPSPPPPFVAADLGDARAHGSSPLPLTWQPSLHAYPAAVTVRRRLDAELVRRGLLASRAPGGRGDRRRARPRRREPAPAPARLVGPSEPIQSSTARRRVRLAGGEKLAAALERFRVDVTGRRALDAGAVDRRLHRLPAPGRRRARRRGRRRAAASSRGRSATDPRVTVLERTNVRDLEPDDIGGPVDLAVADLSFISLLTVAPALAPLHDARRRLRAAGEAAVRGRAAPGSARAASSATPTSTAPCSARCATGSRGSACSSSTSMPSPLPRRRRQRRVPRALRRARPAARRRRRARRRVDDAVARSRSVPVTVRRVGLVPHPNRAAAAELASTRPTVSPSTASRCAARHDADGAGSRLAPTSSTSPTASTS